MAIAEVQPKFLATALLDISATSCVVKRSTLMTTEDLRKGRSEYVIGCSRPDHASGCGGGIMPTDRIDMTRAFHVAP